MPNFDLKHSYLVLKYTDLHAANLTQEQTDVLEQICKEIERPRVANGKVANMPCIIIEQDWPEYQPTIDLLTKRIHAERKTANEQSTQSKSVPDGTGPVLPEES